MAKQTGLVLPFNANTLSFALTSVHTTTSQLIFTAGANDSDVKGIVVSTTDTSAINLQLFITRGGTDYLLGTVTIPAAAGSDGATPSIDLLGSGLIPGLPIDNVGKRYIPMKTGDTLRVAAKVTMTALKICYVNALGCDY